MTRLWWATVIQPFVFLALIVMVMVGFVRQWMCPPDSPQHWTRWFAWHPVLLGRFPFVFWLCWLDRRATANRDMISFRYWTYRRA